MQGLWVDFHDSPNGRQRGVGRSLPAGVRTMTRKGETEADDFFRHDAQALGYLDEDGRGLWAYYTERGMVPPGKERQIARREINGLEMDRDLD